MTDDLYAILGVERSASEADILAAYRFAQMSLLESQLRQASQQFQVPPYSSFGGF